jgi:hypothetical protein
MDNWIAGISAVIALISAIIALTAVRNAKRVALGSTLQYCLEKYVDTMKYKHSAENEHKKGDAVLYYRELFDLFWAETHLWLDDMIPDRIMLQWVRARAASWNGKRGIEISEKGDIVYYKDCWNDVADNTFKEDPDFLEFMAKIHKPPEETIRGIVALKKAKKDFRKRLKEEERSRGMAFIIGMPGSIAKRMGVRR